MSYEPRIFTQQNVPTYRDLVSALEEQSWESIFWSTSKVSDYSETISNVFIYAWKRGSFSIEEMVMLLENNNNEEIQKYLNEGILATCEFFIDDAYSINDEWEDYEIEELAEDMGDEYVSILRQANCTITSRSNAGCGPLTSEFHDLLLDILIEKTKGYCDEE